MSEIRVNNIVNADGIAAPTLPYGVQLPTGIGITGAGGVNITGVVTAANIDGTLIAGSAINSAGVSTVGILTVTKDARIGAAVTVDGAATVTGALTGSTGTFSGAVNIDATTDSTSVTTGALIVDGGVGIAKNVYIGAGLSIAGTLTYEDVTNVDSVGLITAKSGVNISGGQLQVGVAYSVGAAGVCTAAGFVGDLTGAASKVTVTDNESTNENNLITFVADAGTSTGSHALEMDGDLTYTPAIGRLTATQLSGTLQTAAQTNVTSLGTLTGLTVSGDVLFDNGEDAGKDLLWDVSQDALIHKDSVYASWGTDQDMSIWFDGSNSYIQNTTGTLNIRPKSGENGIVLTADADVKIYYDNSQKLITTNDGVNITGVGTFTQGANFTGMLKESCNIVANKLSAGVNIDLEDGMVHYYSTNETTTATPNIRWNSTYSLNNKMNTGDTVTVTIIYKPNGAGYYAALDVDSAGVTEEWNGGSAPSAANAGGYDILTHTLVKTANATFLCFSNVQNYA